MNSDTYNLRFIVNWEMACLSAFRHSYCNATEHTLDDRPSPESGLYRYTEDDNRRRNCNLRDELLRLGYDVTEIEGTTYTENEGTADATEVKETTLVVININDDDDFYANIFQLSELYNQDCFLYKGKNSSRRYIIGTNLAEYPGYGNKVETKWVHENIIRGFCAKLENSCLNSVNRCR